MPTTYKILVTSPNPVFYGDVYAPIKGQEPSYILRNFIDTGKMTESMDPSIPEEGITPDNIGNYLDSSFSFSRIFGNEQDLMEYIKDPIIMVAHKRIFEDLKSRGFEVKETAE